MVPFPCVCQLVEVRGRPRMKISEDPVKSTIPGRKEVYRLVDTEGEQFIFTTSTLTQYNKVLISVN